MNAIATNGDTPLHLAMKLSDENKCLILTKLLVEAGCTPSELDADDKPPIQVAVTRGFVSVVEYLLSRDVRLPSRILFASLQVPVVKRVEMIRLLISKEANVHALHPDGDTLLHVNVRSPDSSVCLEITKRLVDAGCNPLARDIRGETALDIAAKQLHHEVVNYLIPFSSSSDVLSLLQDPAKQASIWYSLICNTENLRFRPEENKKVLQVVEQFTDDEDKCLELAMTFTGDAGGFFARRFGSTKLFDVAASRGFSKVVEFFCSQAVPLPPAFLFTALRYRLSMVPLLICKGADVHVRDETGGTLLHVAVSILEETQCRATAQVLVEAGCDPFALNSDDKQAIHIAVYKGFLSVAEYLLSHYFNTSTSLLPDLLSTALRMYGKKYSMVRLLVNHGANVSYIAPNGDHLLHVLLRSTGEEDCFEITTMLFEAGCSMSAPNARGETPLHIAISRGFASVVDYLLLHNVPLPSDILFFTLHVRFLFEEHASKWTSMITSLVHKGADIHARSNGNTLLHSAMWIAPENLCLEVTKLFVEVGCDPHARGPAGLTPLELATTKGYSDVAEFLRRHSSESAPS